MTVYFDTNVFIYLVTSTSAQHAISRQLLAICLEKEYQIATSVETVQEIIHYSKNIKQLEYGLAIADFVISTVDILLPLTSDVIKTYLDNAALYLSPSSRDLIHLSTCQQSELRVIVSADKVFFKFVDINAFTPEQFLAKYS